MRSLDDETTEAEHRLMHARMAEDAFKDHVLAKEGDGRWYCGKPDTGIYSFRVISAPRCIFLYGDLGDLVLQPSDRDALAWLRGCIKSLDYVLGKATKPEREFLPAEVEAWLKQDEAEAAEEEDGRHRDRVTKLRDLWRECKYEDDRSLAWRRVYVEATGDCEPPACDDWSAQMLWQYHALAKFCQLLEVQP